MKKIKFHKAWVILIACCFMQAGGIGIIVSSSGIFLNPIAQDLNFGIGQLSLYMSIQGLGMVAALPIAGNLLPKLNIRYLVSGAMVICAGTFALMSQFTQLWQWYLAGAIIGFCSGFVFIMPAPIMIGNWFKKKTGLAMGIVMSFSGVGGAIMNPIGISVISNGGWRNAYLILGIISAVLVVPFTLFVIKFKPEDANTTAYGSEDIEFNKNNEKNKQVTGISVKVAIKSFAFICVFIMAGLISFGSTYLQHLPGYASSIGFAAAIGGTMASAVMIGNIVGKLGLGLLNDKIGEKNSTITGLVIVMVSFILLLYSKGNVVIAIIGSFFYGFIMAMGSVSIPLIVRKVFGSKDYSAIFSYVSMGTSLIGSFGISIIGFMYDGFGSYTPSFYVGIAVCVLAILAIIGAFKSVKNLYVSPSN